jgi:adenine/guanine phosphoribosyltransferase-like PRPP-binding protein
MQSLAFSEISARLKELDLPVVDLVLGIATGGLAPAVMAAHQLGCELQIIQLNYRDEENIPRYEAPQHLKGSLPPDEPKLRILLVDDVSVSGKTLNAAKELLSAHEITTLVCKGTGDLVLFPEVGSCVQWPWKVQE